MRSTTKTVFALMLAGTLVLPITGCQAPSAENTNGDDYSVPENTNDIDTTEPANSISNTTSLPDQNGIVQQSSTPEQDTIGVFTQPPQQEETSAYSIPVQSALIDCGIMSESELSAHDNVIIEKYVNPDSGKTTVEGVMYLNDLPEDYDGVPGSTYSITFDESGVPETIMFDGDEMSFDDWKLQNNIF